MARSANRNTGYRRAGNCSVVDIKDEIEITYHELEEQFTFQNERCYWFGILLNPMDIFHDISRYPLSISADRLDNEKPYVLGNVVITSRLANFGRGQSTTEQFSEIMKYIRTSHTLDETFIAPYEQQRILNESPSVLFASNFFDFN
jgi:hypothetical protein